MAVANLLLLIAALVKGYGSHVEASAEVAEQGDFISARVLKSQRIPIQNALDARLYMVEPVDVRCQLDFSPCSWRLSNIHKQ